MTVLEDESKKFIRFLETVDDGVGTKSVLDDYMDMNRDRLHLGFASVSHVASDPGLDFRTSEVLKRYLKNLVLEMDHFDAVMVAVDIVGKYTCPRALEAAVIICETVPEESAVSQVINELSKKDLKPAQVGRCMRALFDGGHLDTFRDLAYTGPEMYRRQAMLVIEQKNPDETSDIHDVAAILARMDPVPYVRLMAIVAFVHARGRESRGLLADVIRTDPDKNVRNTARNLMGGQSVGILEFSDLESPLEERGSEWTENAAVALANSDYPGAADLIMSYYTRNLGDHDVHRAVMYALTLMLYHGRLEVLDGLLEVWSQFPIPDEPDPWGYNPYAGGPPNWLDRLMGKIEGPYRTILDLPNPTDAELTVFTEYVLDKTAEKHEEYAAKISENLIFDGWYPDTITNSTRRLTELYIDGNEGARERFMSLVTNNEVDIDYRSSMMRNLRDVLNFKTHVDENIVNDLLALRMAMPSKPTRSRDYDPGAIAAELYRKYSDN